jgi:hypothetical protein
MANNKELTKKDRARKLFFSYFKKTGKTLSGYSLHKDIDGDVRTLCRYAAEFKAEVEEGAKTPGHRKDGLQPAEIDDTCMESCFERKRLLKSIDDLTKEIERMKKDGLTTDQVKQYIFDLSKTDLEPEIPDWTIKTHSKHSVVVPSFLMSDVHYAEVVKPSQVFGVNQYDRQIARQRIKNLAYNLIDLLQNHISHGEYPGLVLLLAGDFLSGNIHDELIATNDTPIMPAFVELSGIMTWFIQTLQSAFGNLMIFATAGGNHSRITKRVPAKDKAYTNFDWLLYRMLEREFRNEKKINFFISDGDDVQFKILNHKYRMTHGDQFRGGTGFIGPFAPITRNETKKRSAAISYGQDYDTLLIGHFHQHMMMGKVHVNGSVVGYNEFAMKCNFPYEPPKQALWLTHSKRGITGSWPVFCEDSIITREPKDWVSWNTIDESNFKETAMDGLSG